MGRPILAGLFMILVLLAFIALILVASEQDQKNRDKRAALGAEFANTCMTDASLATCKELCEALPYDRRDGCKEQLLIRSIGQKEPAND